MNLSSKQRAYLSSLASTINPIFNIGKASLTPEIIEALDAALEKRELIKVAVLKNCIDDPREIASVIGERTHSAVVKILKEQKCNAKVIYTWHKRRWKSILLTGFCLFRQVTRRTRLRIQ